MWSRVFDSGHLHAKAPPFDHLFNTSGASALVCERSGCNTWMQNSKVLRFATDGRGRETI